MAVAVAVGQVAYCCLTSLHRPVQHEEQRGRTGSPWRSAERWHDWDCRDLVGQHNWQLICPVCWGQFFDTGSDECTGGLTANNDLDCSDHETE